MGATFRDRLGSILMLAFIAILWVQRSYTTPFGGIFPDRVMILMTIFVVVTLILSFTRYRAMKEEEKKESETGEKRWLDMAVVIVIMMLWVLLLRYAGFALSGVVGFASIAWYISGERKNWRMIVKAVVLGLAITYLIIFIFGYLLKVPLPQGEIFG
jgi:putative tricarboxylic transport membrane protein